MMEYVLSTTRQLVRLTVIVFVFGQIPQVASAESPVQLHGNGTIIVSPAGTSMFALAGTATHLGKYECLGELHFTPGVVQGTFTGAGIAVFRAANGDLLVGMMSCDLNARGIGNMAFHWQDSVRFSNGATVSSTGHFAHSRPPGATTLFRYQQTRFGIIAILIGL
jgi:hypothetical protein